MLEDLDPVCHHQVADSLKRKRRSKISKPNWSPRGKSSHLISPATSVWAGWLNASATTKIPASLLRVSCSAIRLSRGAPFLIQRLAAADEVEAADRLKNQQWTISA
jgi:hypothetical protein